MSSRMILAACKRLAATIIAVGTLGLMLPVMAYASECAELPAEVVPLEEAPADVEGEMSLDASEPSMIHAAWQSDNVIVSGESGNLKFVVFHAYNYEKYHVRVLDSSGNIVGGSDHSFSNANGPLYHDVTIGIDTAALGLPVGDYTVAYWMEYRTFGTWLETPIQSSPLKIVSNVCYGNHDFSFDYSLGDPTCIKTGYFKYVCDRCGKDKWVEEYGDHAWDSGVVSKEPVGDAPGERLFTCTLCGETRTEFFRNGVSVERIAGDYANQTSALISSEAFASSEWVVLARDDDFADAMSATGLAGALECPIILTDLKGLSPAAAAEIQRLGAKRAYVIGGRGAMPGDFETQLSQIGCKVEKRLFGEYSWDTSVACADEIKAIAGSAYTDDSIVAMSSNFQDALSISSFAYKYKVPIFLQTQWGNRALPQEAVDRIGSVGGKVYVPGGPGAVLKETVEGVFGEDRVVRMYGEDGYDTSNQIAHYMVDEGLLSADVAVVACGAQGAKGSDALAGAALAGKNGGVILLTNANTAFESQHFETIEGVDSAQRTSFMTNYRFTVDTCYVLGGAFVMPDDIVQKIKGIILAS